MSMEYEQFMRQLQETEDGEPLGKERIQRNIFILFYLFN
jgi:hypothetical protein